MSIIHDQAAETHSSLRSRIYLAHGPRTAVMFSLVGETHPHVIECAEDEITDVIERVLAPMPGLDLVCVSLPGGAA